MVKIKEIPEFRDVKLDIETRRKIIDARNTLNIEDTELQELIAKICEIVVELYNERAYLLVKFRNSIEKVFEFLHESFSEEKYIELELIKNLNLTYKKICNLIRKN